MAFAYSLHKCALGVGEGEFYLDCKMERHPVFLSAAARPSCLYHGSMNKAIPLCVFICWPLPLCLCPNT